MSMNIDEELVRQINEALLQSGERERLKKLVKDKLSQAGWFDMVRAEADKEVQTKNLENFSPQDLSNTIYPKAEAMVPTQVRQEIEAEIRRFLDAHIRIA